jgi:hypothetical protein
MIPALRHLKKIDEKILRLWIEHDGALTCEASTLFLALLEKRVYLLKKLRMTGEKLHPSVCVPPWLEKFSKSTQSISIRELKLALSETQKDLDNNAQ